MIYWENLTVRTVSEMQSLCCVSRWSWLALHTWTARIGLRVAYTFIHLQLFGMVCGGSYFICKPEVVTSGSDKSPVSYNDSRSISFTAGSYITCRTDENLFSPLLLLSFFTRTSLCHFLQELRGVYVLVQKRNRMLQQKLLLLHGRLQLQENE